MNVGIRNWKLCVLFLAVGSVLCQAIPADAAQSAEREEAALKELRSILNVKPRPKTREEALKKYSEMLPQLGAFVKKHAGTDAAAQALIVAAQMSMVLGRPDEAIDAVEKFKAQYPNHPATAGVQFLLAVANHHLGKDNDAKKILTAHLRDFPDYEDQTQVRALLDELKVVGSRAKEFRTTDLAGNPLKLSDLRGKIVFIDFYASWCGPCVAEIPNLKKLYQKYHQRGLEVVGVSLDRTLEDAKDYVKKQGIKWTIAWQKPGGWNNPVARLYGVRSIPSTYLLDREGKVIAVGLRGERLAVALAKLFPEEKKKPEQKEGK